MRRLWLAAASVVLAGCAPTVTITPRQDAATTTTPTTQPSLASTTTPAGQASSLHWIAGNGAVRRWLTVDGGGAVRRAFDSGSDYIVVTAHNPVPTTWHTTAAQSFTSYATLAAAVAQHRLLPGIGALVYDDEDWAQTPVNEQKDPAKYIALAVTLAHQQHLQLIAAPAMDLANALGRTHGETLAHAYMRLRIPAMAAHADAVEIQSQGVETNLPAFAALVGAAVAQVHAVSASVPIFAGLSTSSSSHPVTAAQMEAAVARVSGEVAGFWLNDPAGGSFCPRCTGPYPSVAVAALADLG